MKQLEIGDNYGECFGLDPKEGKKLIYMGGDSWKAISPKGERVIDSADTTSKALEYINRPSVSMGRMG